MFHAILWYVSKVLVVREDVRKGEETTAFPKFWGRMLISGMLYGIMIPILYQGCKKLGECIMPCLSTRIIA